MTIAVLMGPDGVGKSTAGLLVEAALEERGIPSRYAHYRRGHEPFGDEQPHEHRQEAACRDTTRGPSLFHTAVRRIAFLLRLSGIATVFSLKMLRARLTRRVLVMDRSPICVCYCRAHSRYYSVFHRMAVRIVARPDLAVVLVAAPDVVRARKQELSQAQITRLLEFEVAVARWWVPRVRIVSAEGSPSDVAAAIVQVILEESNATPRYRAQGVSDRATLD